MINTVKDNLIILFLLIPCMFATFWFGLWAINKVMGFSIKEIYEHIYEDPQAAAILRIGITFSWAYLVGIIFQRIV